MKVLILSYFDSFEGPKVFLKAPKSFNTNKMKSFVNLMDLQEDNFFSHDFQDYKSVNLPFEIKSVKARGRIESLMISIILIDEKPKLKVLKEILELFVSDFNKIKQVETIFNVNLKKIEQSTAANKFKEVKNFFYSFHKSLPKETVFTRDRNSSIFIFGLDKAGKTTIINRLKKNLFTNPIPTTNINIVRLLFENLSITAYDAAGQKQYRKIWNSYLKNQNGLVFTLDINDESRFSEARSELHRLASLNELKGIPLIILYNKIDLKKPKIKKLNSEMQVKKIKNRPIKSFLTSAKTNKGIDEAFNWIAIQIINQSLFK